MRWCTLKGRWWGGIIAVVLALLLPCVVRAEGGPGQSNVRPIAIVSALPIESDWIVGKLEDAVDRSAFGRRFVRGRIFGRDVVVGVVGVGLVNAPAGASDLLIRMPPRCVILCGTAGGIPNKVKVGDVVIGEKVVNYDWGFWVGDRYELWPTRPPLPPVTGPGSVNPLFIPASPMLFRAAGDAARRVHLPEVQHDGITLNPSPRVVAGIVASMDSFSSSEIFNRRIAEITRFVMSD